MKMQFTISGYDERSADLDGPYRYTLRRRWDPTKSSVAWIMLNPSTADALEDDPTIRRCIGFSRSWGYGGIVVANLFAYRATDPRTLARVKDPVGPRNDDAIWEAAESVPLVVVACGLPRTGKLATIVEARARAVVALLNQPRPIELFCVARIWGGWPGHPLYISGSARPMPWSLPR